MCSGGFMEGSHVELSRARLSKIDKLLVMLISADLPSQISITSFPAHYSIRYVHLVQLI